MSDNKNNGRSRQSWKTAVIILVIFLLYAYGIQVTKVDLEEPLEPKRQDNLVSLIRSLARPDLFTYETETRVTAVSLYMPCPEEIKGTQVTNEGRTVLMVPNCASAPQDHISITGNGFLPHAKGLVGWQPPGAGASRRITDFKVDADGHFEIDFTMPAIRETEEAQKLEIIEVTDRRISGISDTTREALDKIVETVLMALMASTIGTILSIPLSFLAARNLMKNVKAPLSGIMSGIILSPIVGGLGWWLVNRAVSPILAESSTTLASLQTGLSPLGFVGNFIFVIIELIILLLPLIVGLMGVSLAVSLGSRFGQRMTMTLPDIPNRVLTLVTTVVGTAIVFITLAYSFTWINLLGLREFMPETAQEQIALFAIPGLILGIITALLSLRQPVRHHYAVGLLIYNVIRNTFNALRSIEPIMMGFVFVVWVGLGPFAGILALTLHSVADLGKLFSEEVENIDEGPVEAVTATGANQFQTIAYAVVPQITPHYIAYIFYRWDINVRMSTIIGFVGGGGIGFVLQRNINQLLYTKASVMIIAIAVVVTILDNISARIRSRII